MLQPVPGQKWGQYGPLGGENPIGFTPNGISDTLEPAGAVRRQPRHRQLRRLTEQAQRRASASPAGTGGGYGPVGVNGSRVFLPFGLDPKTTPVMGSYKENTVAAKATSAWYELPPRTAGPPAGHRRRRRRDLVLRRGGRVPLRAVAQTAVGRAPARRQLPGAGHGAAHRQSSRNWPGATCVSRWPGRRRRPTWPASSPTTRTCRNDQWFGFTPPRVPVLQTAQQFLGSQTPVLMDIATRRELPLPAAVLRTPRRRRGAASTGSCPTSSRWWCRRTCGSPPRAGGPFLFIQALLTHRDGPDLPA